MKRKQKVALGLAVAAISTITLLGTGIASANAGDESVAARIATKFNLNQTEVQKVVDEYRLEHQADREVERTANLQAKVDAGTITAEQKTLIENRLKELDAERLANKDQDLTHEERQTQMQASRDALKQWATDNGIDLKLVLPGNGMGMGQKMNNHDNDNENENDDNNNHHEGGQRMGNHS